MKYIWEGKTLEILLVLRATNVPKHTIIINDVFFACCFGLPRSHCMWFNPLYEKNAGVSSPSFQAQPKSCFVTFISLTFGPCACWNQTFIVGEVTSRYFVLPLDSLKIEGKVYQMTNMVHSNTGVWGGYLMEVGDSRWFLHLLREEVVQDS